MVVYLNKYWYILLIVISLAGNAFFLFSDNEEYVKAYEDKISVLEEQIKSIQSKNVGLKSEIIELEKESDSLGLEVYKTQEARKDIIRSYEIYLQNVLDLDDSELERWFISRYSDTASSTVSSTSNN